MLTGSPDSVLVQIGEHLVAALKEQVVPHPTVRCPRIPARPPPAGCRSPRCAATTPATGGAPRRPLRAALDLMQFDCVPEVPRTRAVSCPVPPVHQVTSRVAAQVSHIETPTPSADAATAPNLGPQVVTAITRGPSPERNTHVHARTTTATSLSTRTSPCGTPGRRTSATSTASSSSTASTTITATCRRSPRSGATRTTSTRVASAL